MTRLLVAAILSLAACSSAPAPQEPAPPLPPGTVVLSAEQRRMAQVEVQPARAESVAVSLDVPASLAPPESASAAVGSVVEGRVTRVFVLPGDGVEAGQKLVGIHTHELADAERDLTSARAELVAAEAAHARAERLVAVEAVSREELERRRAALEAVRAEVRRASEIVEHLHPSGNDAHAIAPRSGTVFAVHARAGQVVLPGEVLVELGDAGSLWATGHVPESAAGTVVQGGEARVRVEALGASVSGEIVRVGGAIDPVKRTLEVRVRLSELPPGVKPGMYATLELPASARRERVVLPAPAVPRGPEGPVVFVADAEDSFRAVPVRAERLADGRMAVDGVAAGVPVVVRGAGLILAELQRGAAEEAAP